MTQHDTLGALAGLDEAVSDRVRGHRPEVIEAAEESLHALFDAGAGDEAAGLTRAARLLAAARAAHLDGGAELAEFYLELLDEEEVAPAGATAGGGAAGDAATDGPSRFDPAAARELAIGGVDGAAGRRAPRAIRALLRHVDLLVQRPAAATPDDLDALTASGWGVVEIVVLSQIASFVTYQTRVVAGLRVLREAGA